MQKLMTQPLNDLLINNVLASSFALSMEGSESTNTEVVSMLDNFMSQILRRSNWACQTALNIDGMVRWRMSIVKQKREKGGGKPFKRSQETFY